MIKEYKDYWIGFLITALLESTISAFSKPTNDFPIIIEVLLGTIVVILISSILGVVILGISWVFTKQFTLFKFLRTSVIICAVLTIFTILSFIKNMMIN